MATKFNNNKKKKTKTCPDVCVCYFFKVSSIKMAVGLSLVFFKKSEAYRGGIKLGMYEEK